MNLEELREKILPSLPDGDVLDILIPIGWVDQINNAYDQLILIDPQIKISHIKHNMGRIDFGIYDPTPEMLDVVNNLDETLFYVCELCGGAGELKRFTDDETAVTDHVFCEECIKPFDPYA